MKKLSYDYVKKYIKLTGYRLLSTKYINSHEKLKLMCPLKHIFYMNFNSFNSAGKRCPSCAGNKKILLDEIKNEIEKNRDFILLSTQYINAKTKLSIKCKKGHIFNQSFDSFKHKKYKCPKCAKNKKLTYDEVKDRFNKRGFQLISTVYKNNISPLDVVCPNGHSFKITVGNFYNYRGCPHCNRSLPEYQIYNYIKQNYDGIILLNDRKTLKNPLTNYFLELDIYLPDMKKAIEFNGKYWHKNERMKERDLYKKTLCKENQILLLSIDENEWILNKEKCLNDIKDLINERY